MNVGLLYFASLEFSIVTSMNHHTILFHFSNGKPASESWVLGKFIDITHFLPEGPPRLFIYDQNGKIELSVSNSIEVLQDSGFHLNPKEIDVILLKSKGMRAKEIALKLEISTLSVYSIIRDVKQKTGMELLPLVVYLEKMGVIN